MCTGTMHRPINGLVDPFSTFHLLRTYNRLVGPVDIAQYYNISAIKDHPLYDPQFTSTVNKINAPPLERGRQGGLVHVHSQKRHQSLSLVDTERPMIQSPNNRTVTSTTCLSPPPYNLLSSENFPYTPDDIPSPLGPKHNFLALGSAGASVFHLPPDVRSDAEASSVDDSTSFQYFGGRRQRGEKRPIPDEQKDDKYFERRKRNNEAAKKSRDARKMREDRIAFRAAVLEQENAILRTQILALRDEVSTLRQMMCTLPTTLVHQQQAVGESSSGIAMSSKI